MVMSGEANGLEEEEEDRSAQTRVDEMEPCLVHGRARGNKRNEWSAGKATKKMILKIMSQTTCNCRQKDWWFWNRPSQADQTNVDNCLHSVQICPEKACKIALVFHVRIKFFFFLSLSIIRRPSLIKAICYLQRLKGNANTAVAFVYYPMQSFHSFLVYLSRSLSLSLP